MRKSFTFNGKRYEVTGKTQKELDDRYFYKRLELENAKDVPCYTVSEWSPIWLERYKKPVLSEYNYKKYCNYAKAYVLPQIGNKKLQDVTLKDCQNLINSYKHFSDSYINKIYYLIKCMFSDAVLEGLLEVSPAESLVKPKGKKAVERRSLTSEEYKKVESAIHRHPHGLYFALMLYCGLRPYEAGLIQGKDINGNMLRIRGTKTDNADRTVIIPDIVSLPDLSPDEYLFPHLTEQKRKRWWNSFKNLLGNIADDISPYCFRHTYCTKLETAGVPLNVAKQLMGHSNVNLTSKIYTHTSPETWNFTIQMINNSHTIPTSTENL